MASSINASTTTGLVSTADLSGILNLQSNGTTVATVQSTGFSLPTTSTINAANTFGFKNRIINGGMVIDQRNAGASVSTTSTAQYIYTLDRFTYVVSAASKFTVQQNAGAVTPPAGFINYLGCTSTSAYSVSASDYFFISQAIEGLNVADLAWGTANAKTVTLSFQVYSSLTGTFGGSLRNSAVNRVYPFSYSISTANTWTSISITISGDTSGTWLTTNGIGIYLAMSLGAGTTQSGTAGAWAAGGYVSATGAVSVVGTSGATFYITGVQLEVGSQATSFDFRSIGQETALCQRYYYKQLSGVQYGRVATGFAGSTTLVEAQTIFPVTMRIAPTSIDVGGSLGIWQGGTIYAISTLTLTTSGTTTTSGVTTATTSGITSLSAYQIIANNSTTAFLAFSSEL